MIISKQTLRTTYLAKRKMLSQEEFSKRNLLLLQNLQQYLTEHSAETYHCFLPIKKNFEPDTWPLIDLLLENEKKIVISRSNLSSNELTHYFYENKNQLSLNKWGIPEPAKGKPATVASLDVVFIPLIVFDKAGNRIGYGKGYYDRFLSSCRPDVLKIGLSITPPLDYISIAETHDIKMNACITHLGTYSFSVD